MAETEEQIKENKAYCKILFSILESIENVEMRGIQDNNIKVLLMDYIDYGLIAMFLIPDIDKIPTFDINKIDNLRTNIKKIIKDRDPNKVWLELVEYLYKEYTENCTIEEKPITLKEIKTVFIKDFVFPKQLIEKMRDSVTESNNKNQIIEFDLCAKGNIVYGKNVCEEGDISIGHFRVNPKVMYISPNYNDIKLGLDGSIQCLGATNEVYCIIRKDANEAAYNKMKEIIEKEAKLGELRKIYYEKKDTFLDKDIKSGNLEVIDIPLEVEEFEKMLESEHLPGLKLGQYVLPIQVIREMRNTIKEGQTKGIEMAFDLCADEKNVIKTIHKVSWEETSVMAIGVCPKGRPAIGAFHTHSHVQQKVVPSVSDILGTYKMIECIGASEEIKCFLRHNFNEDDFKYLEKINKLYPREDEERLADEIAELTEKYFDFITLI